MRLLALDYEPIYEGVTSATFHSDVSIFDYDAVIWDPFASFEYYTQHASIYRSLPALSEDASVRLLADVKRRRDEFIEFVNVGRILVVVVRPPQICYVDSGKREYSGTGRNRVTTRLMTDFDLLSALPVAECGVTRSNGTKIEFSGDGPVVNLLRKYRQYAEYEAVIINAPGTAFAQVSGTSRVVGSVYRNEVGGYLILLPATYFFVDDEEEEVVDWAPEAEEFQADLLAALEQLGGRSELSRPAWADSYATQEQQRLRDEVVKQQGRIENARAKLAKLQQRKEAAELKDQLFLGAGRALELEVKAVFELLGGVVTEPEPGRADWTVDFPEGKAVLEVKGLTKSAAEKHAAQLEKWVVGTLKETGEMPKGILVANTWRGKPLDERTEADFPDQMLPYCTSQGHCLVTGLQLFVIRAEVEKDRSRAEHWRTQLLETAGKITGCDDWQSIIQVTKAEPEA